MHCRLKFDIGWRALLAAAAGLSVSHQRATEAEARIAAHWPGRHVVIGLSVRTLFDAVLAEIGLAPGEAVLASAINIAGMGEIVAAHGGKVAAVDIDAATLMPAPGALLTAQAATAARVCLVAHLYGAVSRLLDAAELRRRGVLVVEDCAQAFAGRFHLGDPDADVSLFSFGPIKRATALGGGVAVFRDEALAKRVAARIADYAPMSEVWFRRRALKYLVMKALSAPLVYGWLLGATKLAGADADAVIGASARGFSQGRLLDAIRRAPPLRMIALMSRQIASAPEPDARGRACEEVRDAIGGLASIGEAAEKHARWVFAVLVADPAAAVRALRSAGFDATRGATSLRALDPATTPSAQALIDHVVYIPHPHGLSTRARGRLVRVLGGQGAFLSAGGGAGAGRP